jgi:hypothetical protein
VLPTIIVRADLRCQAWVLALLLVALLLWLNEPTTTELLKATIAAFVLRRTTGTARHPRRAVSAKAQSAAKKKAEPLAKGKEGKRRRGKR